MNKQIISIGYQIPGNSDTYVDFQNPISLMDADILLISPDSLVPQGEWISFTTSDGGCYNVQASTKYTENISHLKKELQDHLSAGKNAFIFLNQEVKETLASGASSPRKGQNTYRTYQYSNYNFLPIEIGKFTSASGKHVQFSGNPIFSDFYNRFKHNLKYELYVEDLVDAQIVFTGKDKSKILGAIYKVGPGHLVTLPTLTFNEKDFTTILNDENGKEVECWSDEAIAFGEHFEKCLLDIDKKLAVISEKTPSPEWVSSNQFLGNREKGIIDSIENNDAEILRIKKENERLAVELREERQLKDLLFEQGKPLEKAVIKALTKLGYKAENYDDGELEIDQIITSPEMNRYIGECEGKDNKDINITKFRQLQDALNADFARDEVTEKAHGILFGNAERLIEPVERKLDFTAKCKKGAEREKIALVRTIDLYEVAKYLNENNNEKFRKDCRDAIHKGLGKIVLFPSIPKNS